MLFMEIRWLAVIRDVAIIWILTFLAGFLIGMAGAEGNQLLYACALGNIIFGTVGFTISGCMAKTQRWQHLLVVAVGVWGVSQFNNVSDSLSTIQWLLEIAVIVVMMAVGGALSYLFARTPRQSDCSKEDTEIQAASYSESSK